MFLICDSNRYLIPSFRSRAIARRTPLGSVLRTVTNPFGSRYMHRLRCLGLLLATLVACGAEDPRQPTVEVISLEVLAPACGAPQCHSTSTNQSGYAFDTLAASKV